MKNNVCNFKKNVVTSGDIQQQVPKFSKFEMSPKVKLFGLPKIRFVGANFGETPSKKYRKLCPGEPFKKWFH